jgi:hypothetical protein
MGGALTLQSSSTPSLHVSEGRASPYRWELAYAGKAALLQRQVPI